MRTPFFWDLTFEDDGTLFLRNVGTRPIVQRPNQNCIHRGPKSRLIFGDCMPSFVPEFLCVSSLSKAVFLNRRAAARYRALASIIPGLERPEETTVYCKISLVQLITNLNIILYLSTCHTVYISVLIRFMIMS